MLCPFCHRHMLLKGENHWYCPSCFTLFDKIPLYSLAAPSFKNRLDHHNRPALFDMPFSQNTFEA